MPTLSRWTYMLPLAAVAAGALVNFFLGRAGLHAQIETMARIEVPGQRTLDLKPGQHLVFVEAATPPDAIRCWLHSPGGHSVPLTATQQPEHYQRAGQQGRASFFFETLEPGRHRFTCEAHAHEAHGTTVAVGRGLGSSFPLAFIPTGVGLLLALFLFLIISGKRRGRS